MRPKKRKKLIIVSVILIILINIVVTMVLFKNSDTSKNSVKILEYGFSICTQDVPSSSCGSYEVTVQFSNGTKLVYKVPGYSENESEREQYQQISSEIDQAKVKNSSIVLEINEKNEIIDVQ